MTPTSPLAARAVQVHGLDVTASVTAWPTYHLLPLLPPMNCDDAAFSLPLRGARRTITGIGHTHTEGLWLRGCRSRSRRYFFKALTVWTAVVTAQNGRITVYGIEKCTLNNKITKCLSAKKCV